MKSILTVSQQLKHRRSEMGLSLSQVARRAGTSSTTLSRYENGWTRFETQTLRKLATALGCDLVIELQPRKIHTPQKHDAAQTCRRLKRLFWDHPLVETDLWEHPVWVVERILEYGKLDDIHILCNFMGKHAFMKSVAEADRVSPRTRQFWCQILKMEGMPCTKKYSRNTAWIS